jgi:hypothetical protein
MNPDFDGGLPQLSAEARPDFTDAASCAEWLNSLPLINVAPSHARLLGELEELNCFDMPAAERTKVLELMLQPAHFLQTELAKKITNRAAPLARAERDILINIDALWGALAQGYVRCVQALIQADPELPAKPAALLGACQRALWCVQCKMGEHYKCYRQAAPDDWRLLHNLYALVEERGLADSMAGHPVRGEKWKTSCMEIYAQAVLLNLANPNELSPRQLGLAARWLERFGIKARVVTGAAPAGGSQRPLWIALDAARGASREPPPGAAPEALRVLDTSELGSSLRKRLSALKAGEAPGALGLGEDVTVPTAEALLTYLYRLWCEERPQRGPARRSGQARAALAGGIGAIHFFISGRPFKQPGGGELSNTQAEEIAIFGRAATRRDDNYQSLQGYALESWNVLDESLAGCRLRREAGAGRFLHTQLVACKPADAAQFTLAAVQWLAVDDTYGLDMGLRNIPGLPQPVAVRPLGLNAMAEKYIPALALPALASEAAALRQPATLILPAGWYKPKRTIEMVGERVQPVQLTGVLERGSDYERVTYLPI